MTGFLNYARTFEPARLRAAYTALLALLAVLGVSIPAEADGRITAALAALALIIPLLQGEATRAVVSPAALSDPDTSGDDAEVLDPSELPDDESADDSPEA